MGPGLPWAPCEGPPDPVLEAIVPAERKAMSLGIEHDSSSSVLTWLDLDHLQGMSRRILQRDLSGEERLTLNVGDTIPRARVSD